MHLNVVPMPKREPEKSDKQYCLEFLDKLKAEIEAGEYTPEGMIILISEQNEKTFALAHLLVNVSIIEAVGMLHMAAGDIGDDPPEVNWNE